MTSITFLGIRINSEEQTLSLPSDKLGRLKATLQAWRNKRSATKHQLQQLLGHLNHAASVVRPGRSFTRSLIEASKLPKQPQHRVRLNLQCRADLAWWAVFLPGWNGVSVFPPGPPITTILSDASGSWGCGALDTLSGDWLQLQWPQSWETVNIAIKEMVPIVLAAAVWGARWAKHQVRFRSDNMAIVASLQSRSAREPHLSHLLRCLFFWEAQFSFEHSVDHIPGSENTAADAISRNRAPTFLSSFPQARRHPTTLPPELISLLMDPALSWTSPRWERLFRISLSKVSHPQPTAHITPQREST